jgi:hypothetical protein
MRLLDELKPVPLALAVLLFTPLHTHADFMVHAGVNASAGGAPSDTQDSTLNNALFTSLNAISNSPTAFSQALANAAPGTLGTLGSTTSSSSGGSAVAQATADFSDTLTLVCLVSSCTGPVSLAFDLAITGFLDGTGQPLGAAGLASVFSSFTVGASSGTFLSGQNELDYSRSLGSPEPTVGSLVLTTDMGATIALNGHLEVQASATSAPGFTAFGIASYGNTASFQVDLLTPGVTYISASGVNYATSVPEPSTWGLVLLGILPLLETARRTPKKRRRDRAAVIVRSS